MRAASQAITDEALAGLKQLLGAGGFLVEPADVEPFAVDFRRLYHGRTPLVALPESTARVARLVEYCGRRGIGLVPQGGNTGYCGGATPRESGQDIVVSLRRLNRIRAVDQANDSMTVEAGCVLAAAQAAASAAGRLLPMSLGSEGSCTIGGTVSTNAGGTAVLRYGMMRQLVLGLEVVLPDGRILDQLTALRKDNTGYDVKQWFIGAEGTLGIVTAACLKLFPLPAGHATALVALPSAAAAVELLGRMRMALGDAIATFELIPRLAMEMCCRHVAGAADPFAAASDWYALVECPLPQGDAGLAGRFEHALATAIDEQLATDAVVAASLAQRDALWKLRESIPEAQAREGAGLKHDIAVATSQLPEFIDEGRKLLSQLVPDARLVAYGHLGDGNLHFNLSPASGSDGAALLAAAGKVHSAVHDLVAAYRGSISAEHGIGQLKTGELRRYEDPVALELMHRLKAALDPQGIMNPGKVLTPRSAT